MSCKFTTETLINFGSRVNLYVCFSEANVPVPTGREAELAGVKVGDVVVEVNGRDCRNEIEIPQIMELKMLIQRVKVRGRDGPGEEGVSDAASSGVVESIVSSMDCQCYNSICLSA